MDQQLSALSQDEERKPASKRRYVPGHDRERDTFKPLRAERRRDDDDYEYGVQVLHSLVPCENNVLRFGALYHRWVAPDGKRFYAGKRNDIETLSAVIVDQHDFGELKLDAGYRYTHEYYNDFAAYNIEGSPQGLQNANPIMDEWAEPQHRFNIGGKYELCPSASLYANYSFGQVDAPPGAVLILDERPSMVARATASSSTRRSRAASAT